MHARPIAGTAVCAAVTMGLLTAAPVAGQAGNAPEQEPPRVDMGSGGVTISSGVNSLSIGARVQFRWTLDRREEADADTGGTGEDRADGSFSQFDVPRMRVTLAGGAFRPWLRYQFQFDFSRTSGEGDSKIKDAYLEIRPSGRPYRFVAGQFKAPFGLQQLVSSGRQQFVDRAITDSKFTPGRDMGVMLAGTAAARRVGYEVGLFNGSGESLRQAKQLPLWVARFVVTPLGAPALTEGSPDAPEQPTLHLGVAARGGSQVRGRTPDGIVQDADSQTAYGLEFAYRARRLSSTAEYFWMTDEQENPQSGPDLESRGFHAQVGYMLVPRTVEVAGRYARVDGDDGVSDADVTEARGVFGYFWRVHNLKLQVDAGQVRYGARFASLSSRARSGLPGLGARLVSGQPLADTQVRAQLQLSF